MNVSKSLQYCLNDTGIMKKKLAEKLKVTPQTVSTLLKSKTCTGDMLQKLADFFGMSVSEFIAIGE